MDCTAASNGASLITAIGEVNAGSCDTINITGNISLASEDLPIISRSGASIIIRGSGGPRTVDGTGTSRLFTVVAGDVSLQDFDITGGLAKGGDGGVDNSGGGAGGGALGAGGGVFVAAGASLTLNNVDLSGNSAQGGNGGNAPNATGYFSGGSGGGGLNGGDGGGGTGTNIGGGAGGAGGFGASGVDGAGNNGGVGGIGGDGGIGGAGGTGAAGDDGSSGSGMGGGGGGSTSNNNGSVPGQGGSGGVLGGGGGGGGLGAANSDTGAGGTGGNGGFGGAGGGGGSLYEYTTGNWAGGTGGLGGFGAGGGGGGAARALNAVPTMIAGVGGSGGLLAGAGGSGGAALVTVSGGGGGGGAGLGGALFVQNGGTLIIGEGVTFGGSGANAVVGGTGGSSTNGTAGGNGSTAGGKIYAVDGAAGLGSTASVGFDVATGQTRNLSDLDLLQTGFNAQLSKSGAGELALTSGTAITSGGWSVSAGSLRANTDNLSGDLDNDGLVYLSQGFNGTYAGDVTGSGGLVKTGTGTVTLSGNNDAHSGSVRVEGGSLSVNGSGIGDTSAVTLAGGSLNVGAAGETIGSLAGSGNVSLSGVLTTGGDNSSTAHSGNVSGSGSLIKSGTGTLTLSGTNSYSGGTTVSAGRLVGTTSSLDGDILNNATVEFDQSSAGTYDDDMSGSGSLVKSGTGTVTLSGTNSYSGATTVNAGTLSVNGSIASTVTVASGGTLQGSGSFGDIISNGTLAPGNSIGTMTVSGDLTLGPDNILEVEFDDAGNADRLNVSGNVILDGILRVMPEPGSYVSGTLYTIIDAASITGTFSGEEAVETTRLAGLEVEVTVTGDQVLMELNGASFEEVAGEEESGGGSIAEYIDALRPKAKGDLQDVISELEVLPVGSLDAALNALTPKSVDVVPTLEASYHRLVTGVMSGRLNRLETARVQTTESSEFAALSVFAGGSEVSMEGPRLTEASSSWKDDFLAISQLAEQSAAVIEYDEDTYSFWVQMIGESGIKEDEEDSVGYDYQVFGIASGLERRFSDEWEAGIIFAGGQSEVDFDRNRGGSEGRTLAAGAFVGWMPVTGLQIELMTWGDMTRLESQRNIRFGGVDRRADSEADVHSLGGELKVEIFENVGEFRYSGFGSLGYLSSWREDYCETGAGSIGLCVESTRTGELLSELGFGVSYEVDSALTVDAKVAVTSSLPTDDRITHSGFIGEDSFVTSGDDEKKIGLSPQLDLIYQANEEISFIAEYSGQFEKELIGHSLRVGVSVSF